MIKKKSATLNLRVDPLIKEAIRDAAERQHRSIANMVESLIREHSKLKVSLCRYNQAYLVSEAMNSKTLKALIEAGAVKSVCIVADGANVHATITTGSDKSQPATTFKGDIKTWSTIDSAAKWVRINLF